MTKDETTTVIKKELLKGLKVYAAKNNMRIKDIINSLASKFLEQENNK